jgi:hypothetical protein
MNIFSNEKIYSIIMKLFGYKIAIVNKGVIAYIQEMLIFVY